MADKKDKKYEDEEEQENKDESTNTDTSAEDVKTESDNVDTDKQDTKAGDDKKDDTNNVDDTDTNDDTDNKTVPYTRFKEVNDKYKAVQKELDELKNNQSNNTNDSSNQELEQYKTAFNELYQSKLDIVPDEYKELIPDGDDLSKLNWIDSAISKGLFTTKKVESFGNQGNNPAEQEKEDNTSFIRNLGRRF